MNSARVGTLSRVLLTAILMVSCSSVSFAQEFKTFSSDKYGFTMKYPANWIKIERPESDQYVVFETPEMTGNFRSRVHVAVYSPVSNLGTFLQELRDGLSQLQEKSEDAGGKREVQILDEGEFKCDVPGAYFLFVKTYENNMKIWMNIVFVFYQHDKTVLRVSCFTPSEAMNKIHKIFNDVLLSIAFIPEQGASREGPVAAPAIAQAPPSGETSALAHVQPQASPLAKETTTTPSSPVPPAQPPFPLTQPQVQPAPARRPEVEVPQLRPEGSPPVQPPRRTPRGPLRDPARPATGIVQ